MLTYELIEQADYLQAKKWVVETPDYSTRNRYFTQQNVGSSMYAQLIAVV